MRFNPYPKYKPSGLDWLSAVPEYWHVTKLKHVASFSTGWTPPTGESESYIGENLWANISDLGNRTIHDTTKRISDEAVKRANINVSPIGSLLFSFKLSIGQVSFAGREMYTNEAIATFTPGNGIHVAYAYYAYPLFLVKNASENIYGAKLLNQSLINNATIVAPNLAEQSQIANFLDRETAKIDTLINKQEKLIELLKEKRQAVISHAVTKGLDPTVPMKDSGVEWLGAVPEHWEIRAVNSISTKITNGFVGPTRDILVPEGVPYIQATHVKNGRVRFDGGYFVTKKWSEEHAKSMLKEGDILIVQTGAGTGDVALCTHDEVDLNCHALIIVSADKKCLNGAFLSAVFQSTYGRSVLTSIQTGAMHPHLNCGEVKFVKIPLPPLLEQVGIVKTVEEQHQKIDALIAKAEQAIALQKEHRTALISAAVTGKIDVRNEVLVTKAA